MRKYTAAKAALEELRDMQTNDLLLVKVLGAPTGIVYDTRAIAEFIYDSMIVNNGPSDGFGVLAPFVDAVRAKVSDGVAAHCAEHGLSGPEAIGRETFIDIIIQLLPLIIQFLPLICPT